MAYPYGPNLNLPNAPTQYTNPLLMGNLANQSGLANQLTSGDFTGDLSWLSGLTNPNSGYLQNALSAAQGTLQPQFRDTIQQLQNTAAANGSLNSSTFTDALARAGSDLNSAYQTQLGNAAMQDYTNANNNRLSLFGSGLSLGQQAIGNQTTQGNNTNTFNLDNYGNIVAKAISDNENLQTYPQLQDILSKLGGTNNAVTMSSSSGLGSMFGNNLKDNFGQPVEDGLKNMFGQRVPSANTSPYYPSVYGGTVSTGYNPQSSGGLGGAFNFSAPTPNAYASNNPFGGSVNTTWNPTAARSFFN